VTEISTTAGIVLCGGDSRRMGRPKVTLPFGPETMLARVVRLLGEAVDAVVVAGGLGQPLPPLPPWVLVVGDRRKDRGPLEGLAVGLRAAGTKAEAAFVTGCDAPLLLPAFVRRMVELSAGYDVAVPHVAGLNEPLSAVYRTGVLPQAEALLAAGRLRPVHLFDQVRTRRVTADELADIDPQLQSLTNVNSPEDYRAALEQAGLGKSLRP
jgi:molybdopterin-guanine dinucleotide biosynthesis protein A